MRARHGGQPDGGDGVHGATAARAGVPPRPAAVRGGWQPGVPVLRARPEWRALAVGVTPGPDVAQLDGNLIALGYATAATLTVSGSYTDATGYAVARWQQAAGLTVTGTGPGSARSATRQARCGSPRSAHPGRAARGGRHRADRDVRPPGGHGAASGGPGVSGPAGRPGHRDAAERQHHRPGVVTSVSRWPAAGRAAHQARVGGAARRRPPGRPRLAGAGPAARTRCRSRFGWLTRGWPGTCTRPRSPSTSSAPGPTTCSPCR